MAKVKVMVTSGILINNLCINKMANKITAPGYRVNFVEHLYFDHDTNEMTGVTLRNGSRLDAT